MIEAIRAHQWRQGSVIPPSMHVGLASYAPRPLNDDDCCIVISQSCDVVHGDLAVEPIVELVLARPLPGALDGTFTHAKNARRLQFCVRTSSGLAKHEALVRDRFSIPRHQLAGGPPDPTRRVEPEDLRALVTWVLSRYGRQAFPDEFNKRTGPISEKKVRPILKRLTKLKSLYVSLKTWDELPPEKSYEVYLLGTLQVEDYKVSATRSGTEKGILEIAAALQTCDGISVINAEVQSESEVTLDHVRNLVRWNLDYISLQDKDNHVFAALDL